MYKNLGLFYFLHKLCFLSLQSVPLFCLEIWNSNSMFHGISNTTPVLRFCSVYISLIVTCPFPAVIKSDRYFPSISWKEDTNFSPTENFHYSIIALHPWYSTWRRLQLQFPPYSPPKSWSLWNIFASFFLMPLLTTIL